MEISQKLLCFLFLSSFALGLVWGGFYDLLFLIRLLLGFSVQGKTSCSSVIKRFPRRIMMIVFLFWEDLIFLLAGGIGLILLLYLINDGQFRMMAIVGLACGFFVWHVTAGRLMARISEKLVVLIRKLLRIALRYVALPFRLIGKWLYIRCILPLKRALAAKRVRKQILMTQQVIQKFQVQAEQVFSLSVVRDENTKN